MPRIKKPKKVKEPIRLRMKDLSDGSKSLYLDIYRNGKRTYEYLKLYLIPGTQTSKFIVSAYVFSQTRCEDRWIF